MLIALGVGCGKKTTPLPNWIVNGSDLVKREFISAFQGGNGCAMRWNKFKRGHSYIIGETSQSSNPEIKDSLMNMMKQCVQILEYFGIEINYLEEREAKEKNRVRIVYKISNKQENLIKYFEIIGYRYAWHKIVNSKSC